MNWVERLYEIQKLGRKDLYSQHGEGLYLEYIIDAVFQDQRLDFIDIGGGDGFYLSNTRHLVNLGATCQILDKYFGDFVKVDNIVSLMKNFYDWGGISIDIDGNDYWILDKILANVKPIVIIAEFNAHYTDSRTIKYDPDFVWAGDSYYGFTFEAGKKLAEANGYTVIFQNDNLNMYMVRNDLINVTVPPVTYKKLEYFKMSERTDWVTI